MSSTQLTPEQLRKRHRNRIRLLGIFGLFFGVMLIAGLLRFSGWRPAGLKMHGTLMNPPIDARQLAPATADGGTYAWGTEGGGRRWRMLVVNGPTCAAKCEAVAADLDKVWQLMGQNKDKLDVLWMGATPKQTQVHNIIPLPMESALRRSLPASNNAPTEQGMPVYIIDPNGFIMMQYAPGADVSGMRVDLAKVLKLI